MSDKFIKNIATQGSVGYGQAPGTMATIMMLPLVWFLGTGHLSVLGYGAFSLLLFCFGWYVTTRALPFFDQPDPSAIVIDEMSCFFAAFIGVPISWQTLLAGFILFRLLDIYKPWFIGWLDQQPGVAGVMLDDLAAALMANVLVQALLFYGLLH